MERHGEEVRETAEEARAGATPGVMRWVLGISLLLAIVAMTVIWTTGTGLN
jgi:uncharacterized membrane protein